MVAPKHFPRHANGVEAARTAAPATTRMGCAQVTNMAGAVAASFDAGQVRVELQVSDDLKTWERVGEITYSGSPTVIAGRSGKTGGTYRAVVFGSDGVSAPTVVVGAVSGL